jgi:hypothetical protein
VRVKGDFGGIFMVIFGEFLKGVGYWVIGGRILGLLRRMRNYLR